MKIISYIIYGRKKVGDPFEEIGKSFEEPTKEEWKTGYNEIKICRLTVTRFDYKREYI